MGVCECCGIYKLLEIGCCHEQYSVQTQMTNVFISYGGFSMQYTILFLYFSHCTPYIYIYIYSPSNSKQVSKVYQHIHWHTYNIHNTYTCVYHMLSLTLVSDVCSVSQTLPGPWPQGVFYGFQTSRLSIRRMEGSIYLKKKIDSTVNERLTHIR
jgi:hypothetical protein